MKVVGYVRLSRDEDKENYSSIIEQQNIIKEYANENNLKIDRFYIDDNYSGYTFDRPAFKQLLDNVDKGEIDLILAKDFSRIGRKNASVLMFVDTLLDKNIDLILINERKGPTSIYEDDDMMGIQTWFNEMYVKDISRKIRANMRSKQKKGTLIMSVPYGYKKEGERVIVDHNVSHVVKMIFNLYINGYGYKRICDVLNSKGVLTPAAYKKQQAELNKGKSYKTKTNNYWNIDMVQSIIKNDFYVGTLRTHKYEAQRIKQAAIRTPKHDNFVFANHHEAIINDKIFKQAQELNKKRQMINYRGIKKRVYLFSGIIECGDCGRTFSGRVQYNKSQITGYNCNNYITFGNQYCSNHFIREIDLITRLHDVLKVEITKYESMLKEHQLKNKEREVKKDILQIEKEYEIVNNELKVLYSQKIKDLMTEKDEDMKVLIEKNYKKLEQEKKQAIKFYNNRLQELYSLDKKELEVKIKNVLDFYNEILSNDKFDRKTILELIKKVRVYNEQNPKERMVEFEFTFLL